ncbi:RNA polymerase sigma factor [Citricoccus muralis]|uniref:Sigma-70 family RNA polymerase sigma factor n=1 Tax=Citricoccus muralis TaxID=169134 RepID=A0ABY8H5W9_9MICC|nr:sigma-70 family RNA polymerase sigma factor [Citricoccus muralis]WFP16500.1 sigma-70 family RNA polymerase sigma factor [Citricoccus muralis]
MDAEPDPHLVTLVLRAQDGDVASFEELVLRYQTPLFRMAYRTLNSRVDAEDAVQDTFTSAWTKLDQLRQPEAFSSWLYRQCVNRCRDLLRRRGSQSAALLSSDLLDETTATSAADTDPVRQAEQSSSMDELGRLLESLPEEQRMVWVLRELQHFSYQQIADALEITEPTARGRLARARKSLAEGMEGWR